MPCESCYACYGEIADVVVNTNGLYNHQSKGAGTDLLHRIWRGLGSYLMENLISKRSCIIPDFFHASIKEQRAQRYEGMRVFYKPQFVLLPDFLSKYHLQNVLQMSDAHYHATVPHIVNYTEVADLVGTDRFTVQAAVCDSAREIGKYLVRNPRTVLTIDIGVALLEFRGREYRVRWSNEFLNRFSAEVGPQSMMFLYHAPSMSPNETNCRFHTGCLTRGGLEDSLADTVDREKRMSIVDMHDSKGGSEFRKSFW